MGEEGEDWHKWWHGKHWSLQENFIDALALARIAPESLQAKAQREADEAAQALADHLTLYGDDSYN